MSGPGSVSPVASIYEPRRPPEFSGRWAVASVASLFAFAVVTITAAAALGIERATPWWGLAPFVLAGFGSALGFGYELWLLKGGTPFWLRRAPTIFAVRTMNVAPVFGAVLYLYWCLLVPGAHPDALSLVAVLVGALTVTLVFSGPKQPFVATAIAGSLVSELFLAARNESGVTRALLVAHPVLEFVALGVDGTESPKKSTHFHVFSAVASLALAFALWSKDAALVASAEPFGRAIIAALVGAVVAVAVFPTNLASFRALASNFVWPRFYMVLAGGPMFPMPLTLSEIYDTYKTTTPPMPRLLPYHVVHRRRLSYPLAVPALKRLTHAVRAYGPLEKLVKTVFSYISVANAKIPHADLHVPLVEKPRLDPRSDGSDAWPELLLAPHGLVLEFLLLVHQLPGQTFEIPRAPGAGGPLKNGLQETPVAALDAYLEGNLLAYLCESGLGATFLETADPGLVSLDLSFLDKYDTKPDYEPYGGKAYFKYDATKKRLVVDSVVAPRTSERIAANRKDPTFRHAEALILASLYYQVVSGKHLAEIHMTYSLVEVAMKAAFDARGKWRHPIRVALYRHFFAHELAEELTTENLVEDGGVFPQIFATTNASLIRHLNDVYHAFAYGRDEDFEHRTRVLEHLVGATNVAHMLPDASLNWEIVYDRLWKDYADSLVAAVYPTDESQPAQDANVEEFFKRLQDSLIQPLPARYDGFKTRKGLARFIADTIHHVVVQHEVYGTTSVRTALDPRINSTQVPRDGGPPGLDEWRSLACIGLATSRVRYRPLMGDPADPKKNFKFLLADIEDKGVQQSFAKAFDKLDAELVALESRWTATPADKVYNYERLRPTPRELQVSAGY